MTNINKQKVLDKLKEGRSCRDNLAEDLDLNTNTIFCILESLFESGKIVQDGHGLNRFGSLVRYYIINPEHENE